MSADNCRTVATEGGRRVPFEHAVSRAVVRFGIAVAEIYLLIWIAKAHQLRFRLEGRPEHPNHALSGRFGLASDRSVCVCNWPVRPH